MREHTTHFDDCGCLTARKDVEISALAARVTELEAENKRTREALAGATDELERLSDIICPEDVDLVEQVLIPARAALEAQP